MHSSNPHLHSEKDTLDKIQPSYGVEFLKLAISFTVEVSQAGTTEL